MPVVDEQLIPVLITTDNYWIAADGTKFMVYGLQTDNGDEEW